MAIVMVDIDRKSHTLATNSVVSLNHSSVSRLELVGINLLLTSDFA